MQIPDYLIYDEYKRREDRRDDGLQPLHLPLYQPEDRWEEPQQDSEEEENSERGVIIIDMNTGVEIDD